MVKTIRCNKKLGITCEKGTSELYFVNYWCPINKMRIVERYSKRSDALASYDYIRDELHANKDWVY